MSQYHPVRFVDVRLEGDFWKERLDTVLKTTILSQHRKLGEYGILDSLKLPQPLQLVSRHSVGGAKNSRTSATSSSGTCTSMPPTPST